MPEITMKPIGVANPIQSRPNDTLGTEAHRQLIESVRLHGILQPPGVRPNGEAVWGTGRIWLPSPLNSRRFLVVILDKEMTEAEYRGLPA